MDGNVGGVGRGGESVGSDEGGGSMFMDLNKG